LKVRLGYVPLRHHWTQAYVRRDLALLWRSRGDIRLVWGLEPTAGRPRRTSRTTRSGAGSAPAWAGDRPCAQPTLAARCRGSTLSLWHPDGKIGGHPWEMASTFTGLATSNVGGVGFLEQTIPGR
jgi:hypothetical protein